MVVSAAITSKPLQPHKTTTMKVYIDLYCSVTDDQERFTDDDTSSIEIEIDENANWDMPTEYASCGLVARRIENYMEWWIANRFDANDFGSCPDEYYDSRND